MASDSDTRRGGPGAFGPVTVTPLDRQYADLVRREQNQRFVGTPDAVTIVGATDQVAPVVEEAVRTGRRLTVISGGHCMEGFVFEPDVDVVLDVSRLDRVYYDPDHDAVAVESGAKLLKVYETLYEAWGVTVPGGVCHAVGVGGHVAGGGWGLLCRQHGLITDHLYGVEVVVVDADGRARTVVATRRDDDPDRELWWAHTGGGGGNFGVVTRYLFRTPGTGAGHPSEILVRPPAAVWLSMFSIPWSTLTETGFHRLIKNFGDWHAANSAPDDPNAVINSDLVVAHRNAGEVSVITQVDATEPDAERRLADYLDALLDGVDAAPDRPRRLPWLQATRYLGTDVITLNNPTLRADHKSSYMRGALDDAQIALFHDFLTRDLGPGTAQVRFSSYGGAVNAVAEGDTAHCHRDSAYQMLWIALWGDEADDDRCLAWFREFYASVWAGTGGVPVPGAVADGCYVNYPDLDLGDPEWNRSGVPWHDLYYKGNYPRLQAVKRRWDPRDVFRHAQSVRLPS